MLENRGQLDKRRQARIALPSGRRPSWPASGRGPIPDDPALPGLGEALSPARLRDGLAELHPSLIDVGAPTIEYVRYKPGQSCVVQYRLPLNGEDVVLIGRVEPRDAHERTVAKASNTLRTGDGELAAGALTDLGLTVTRFPHDRSVRALKLLLHPRKLRRLAEECVPGFAPEQRLIKTKHARIDVVSYKPERRCLARCTMKYRERPSGAAGWLTTYARAYADEAGLRAHAALRALRRAEPVGEQVPEPLGYHAAHRVLFVASVRGHGLLGTDDEAAAREAVGQAGRWLGALQRLSLRPERQHDAGRLLDEAERVANRLKAARVEEAALFLDAIRTLRASRADHATCCAHGDFHPGQLLVSGQRTNVVDFDEIGTGAPALDVGYFAAHLEHHGRLGLLPESARADGLDWLLKGMEREGARPPAPEDIDWFRRLSLLRLALSSVKHLQEDWPASVRRLLAEVRW